MNNRIIKIATRKSELALWQANHVADLLRQNHPGLDVELLPMVTKGDIILDQPLAKIGGKGLFLKELERSLMRNEADIAVHSMKDVPVEEVPGLVVDVVLERANPFDALLSNSGVGLADLPNGSRIGTSSLRRQCQLKSNRPDLEVADLRGNVNTRLRKLHDGEYDAIILACAGLERLGMQQFITETLQPPNWLPAGTQGTIGIQCRQDDADTIEMIQPLQHSETALRTYAERKVATALQGSCQVPLAIFAQLHEQEFHLAALVGTPDGQSILRSEARGDVSNVDELSERVANDLLQQGADEIIAALS
jgi:hydroxymethylbilane synthase